MTRIKTATIAITRRIWINPPIVLPVINPSSQSTISTTKIVHNIASSSGSPVTARGAAVLFYDNFKKDPHIGPCLTAALPLI